MNAPRHVYTWEVGRFTAYLQIDRIAPGAVNHVNVHWEPCIPDHLSPAEQLQYQRGLIEGLARARSAACSQQTAPEEPPSGTR